MVEIAFCHVGMYAESLRVQNGAQAKIRGDIGAKT